MSQIVDIVAKPDEAFREEILKVKAARVVRSYVERVKVLKRSVDARGKRPVYRLRVEVFEKGEPLVPETPVLYKGADLPSRVIIVGMGPAGMFAALRLLEYGVKPIIIERGKDVRERRRDLRAIQQFHTVNPDSNYCFGEGGAGTYSDGKLYTRSDKRGDIKKILRVLVQHGAVEDIMVDAHPHIGSNKLPLVVQQIRETIISHGGEVHFNARVTDLILREGTVTGVEINGSGTLQGDAVILATGHSARDIYQLLQRKEILLERKDFAMGVRIEHPQSLIDEVRYHTPVRPAELPAASYSAVCQVGGRGVFSFCMCPGGIIVPASTAPEELVVNGMSLSRRDSPFANSGFVAEVKEEDLIPFQDQGILAGLAYQASLERMAFEAGGKTQVAPAQRVTDFLQGKESSSLPGTSYIPGITTAPLHALLPKAISTRLQGALKDFNRKMKGYITSEAIMVGVESRTSSPLRIPRDKITGMHLTVQGLFPSGEGAGYAGGIVSAAVDGEKSAGAVLQYLQVPGFSPSVSQ